MSYWAWGKHLRLMTQISIWCWLLDDKFYTCIAPWQAETEALMIQLTFKQNFDLQLVLAILPFQRYLLTTNWSLSESYEVSYVTSRLSMQLITLGVNLLKTARLATICPSTFCFPKLCYHWLHFWFLPLWVQAFLKVNLTIIVIEFQRRVKVNAPVQLASTTSN